MRKGPGIALALILVLVLVLVLAPLGCTSGGSGSSAPALAAPSGTAAPPQAPASIPGTSVRMEYASSASSGFYDAPFPDESRRRAGGGIDLDRFPNRGTNLFVEALASIAARDSDGFGLSSGIFFSLTGAVDKGALPSVDASVARSSPVFLLGVDPLAPDYLRRYPVDVDFRDDGGPFGAPSLLSMIPLTGVPLREGTLYAAVVLRRLGDAGGAPLGVPLAMAEIAAGVPPAGMAGAAFQAHQAALAALRQDGVGASEVAALAVFRTGNPTRALDRFRDAVLARPLPQPTTAFALVDVQPEYCLLRTTIRVPVFQSGAPPFVIGGGGWEVDAAGSPIPQGTEEANLFVTVPRRAMPAAGFPAVVMVRTGFGQGEKPIADRAAFPSGAPGTGPGHEFARAGFLGVQLDGPHGGRRNVSRIDEQLLMFNFANPLAMRDNVRQSALELVLLAEVLPSLRIDAALCPGASTPQGGPVRIDAGTLALFGHSMGATVAPLVLASSPRYGAAILSGAGASWIENVLYKQRPVPILPMAELILGYPALGRGLVRHDPVLSLLQWAGEPADPLAYARLVSTEPRSGAAPRHVLMLQGIVDSYILPPIANGMSLGLGLDLAGPALDAALPVEPRFTPPLARVLPHTGGVGPIPLPVAGNRGACTAVVVQLAGDGVQDGHEVVFQRDEAKLRYRTFLETWAAGGLPVVP